MTRFRYIALPAAPFLIAAEGPPVHRAIPTNNPGIWLNNVDYPMDAAWAEIEGVTAFMLEVGIAGTPIRCTVTSSSGSASLDTATCTIMMERARFTPARDGKGRPVRDFFNSKIYWRLP
jgi:protein TonB